MARRHQDVTVREGTSERHWQLIAGYLAIVIVGTPLAIVLTLAGNVAGAATAILAVSVVFVFGGILVMPSLFKDSAYVRDTRRGWKPRWWYYIGVPLAIGMVSYPAASAFVPDLAAGAAMANLSVAAFVSHAVYIYRRHKFLSVP